MTNASETHFMLDGLLLGTWKTLSMGAGVAVALNLGRRKDGWLHLRHETLTTSWCSTCLHLLCWLACGCCFVAHVVYLASYRETVSTLLFATLMGDADFRT